MIVHVSPTPIETVTQTTAILSTISSTVVVHPTASESPAWTLNGNDANAPASSSSRLANNPAAIGGIVVAIIFILVIILLGGIYAHKRERRKHRRNESDMIAAAGFPPTVSMEDLDGRQISALISSPRNNGHHVSWAVDQRSGTSRSSGEYISDYVERRSGSMRGHDRDDPDLVSNVSSQRHPLLGLNDPALPNLSLPPTSYHPNTKGSTSSRRRSGAFEPPRNSRRHSKTVSQEIHQHIPLQNRFSEETPGSLLSPESMLSRHRSASSHGRPPPPPTPAGRPSTAPEKPTRSHSNRSKLTTDSSSMSSGFVQSSPSVSRPTSSSATSVRDDSDRAAKNGQKRDRFSLKRISSPAETTAEFNEARSCSSQSVLIYTTPVVDVESPSPPHSPYSLLPFSYPTVIPSSDTTSQKRPQSSSPTHSGQLPFPDNSADRDRQVDATRRLTDGRLDPRAIFQVRDDQMDNSSTSSLGPKDEEDYSPRLGFPADTSRQSGASFPL